MSMFGHTGIRLRITLAFGAVFTLLSLGLNLYCYHKIKVLIIQDNDRYLLTRARSLLDKTEVNPVIIPLPDKGEALKVYSRVSSGQRSLLFRSPGMDSVLLPARQGVTDTLDVRVAYVASSSDDSPAELMLAVSNASLESTLRYLFLLLILSTLISVAIAALVSYWLAQFFLLPLQRITDTAKNINMHQLRERVPLPESRDELRDLASTLNDMLERIDKALQQQQNFFASASHELKTPLAVLRAELELNLKKQGLDSHLKQFLSSQLEEINRLQDVVQEFLVISQIRENTLRIHTENFDLSLLVIKVFNQLKPLAALRGIGTGLDFDLETDGFLVGGDQDKLKMVLLNLLENAIKYSPSNTSVYCHIRSDPATQHMQILFSNRIEQALIDTTQLTKAFHRGEVWQQGSGIGLWLCREIVQAHHGQLTFESSNHTFNVHIALPL